MISTSTATGAAALGLCAALAVATVPAHAAGAPTAAGNRHLTRIEARHLRSLAELPSTRTKLSDPPRSLSGPAVGIAVGTSLVDAKRFRTVRMPFRQALRWARHHPPAGLSVTATGSVGQDGRTVVKGFAYNSPDRSPAWEQPVIEVTIARAGPGATAWRIDGMAIWLDPDPVKDTAGPGFHPTLRSGCPASDRRYQDVRNRGRGLDLRLLPKGRPASALLCAYTGLNGADHTLRAHHRLGSAHARRLAALAAGLRLSHPRGEVRMCPADLGSAVVIVFRYPGGRTVDLWYADTGCPSVRNGHILTESVSPAFARTVRRDLR